MRRVLQKWNGAGNDFLVDVLRTGEEDPWSTTEAATVCHRHGGLGADGLLIASETNAGWRMVLLNADGSRAEMSGNGIRCFAAAVVRATGALSPLTVWTDAGPREVQLTLDGTKGRGSSSMGTVTLDTPLAGTLGVASVGNPHVVVRDVATWSNEEREALAVSLSDQMGGANVEFVTRLHPARVKIVVYERGVGWTQACGTGSVAMAAVLHALGETGPDVVVENPGGELIVRLHDGQATLEGPMAFEGDLEWTL